jgi:hypothetical protein
MMSRVSSSSKILFAMTRTRCWIYARKSGSVRKVFSRVSMTVWVSSGDPSTNILANDSHIHRFSSGYILFTISSMAPPLMTDSSGPGPVVVVTAAVGADSGATPPGAPCSEGWDASRSRSAALASRVAIEATPLAAKASLANVPA